MYRKKKSKSEKRERLIIGCGEAYKKSQKKVKSPGTRREIECYLIIQPLSRAHTNKQTTKKEDYRNVSKTARTRKI